MFGKTPIVSMSTIRHFTIFICAILALTATDAWARRPRAREKTAFVERIDFSNSTLVVTFAGKEGAKSERIEIKWTRNTTFLRRGQIVVSSSLEVGARITIWYYSPAFGKRFARRIEVF